MFKFKNRQKALSLLLSLALIVSLFAGLGLTASAVGQTTEITNSDEWEAFVCEIKDGERFYGQTVNLRYNVLSQWGTVKDDNLCISMDNDNNLTVTAGVGFAGTFNGNGCSINVYDNFEPGNGQGLFGYLEASGTIRNLTVNGSTTIQFATDHEALGGVVGFNAGTIENVTCTVNISAQGSNNIGGIAGFVSDTGVINNCAYTPSSGIIGTGINYGGIAGRNEGIIINSHNTAQVTGGRVVGGIAGQNFAHIASCYNTGEISTLELGANGAGGIAGRNGNNNIAVWAATIVDCFNTGAINGGIIYLGNEDPPSGNWVGGITAFNNALSIVRNCYNTGVISGNNFRNPIIGNNQNPIQNNPIVDNVAEGTWGNNYSLVGGTYQGTVAQTGTRLPLDLPGNPLLDPPAMKSAALATALNEDRETSYWAGANGHLPWLTNSSTVDDPLDEVDPEDPGGGDLNLPIVYLSNSGNDVTGTGEYGTPVRTLERAVEIASVSTTANVYIAVLNTIQVNANEEIIGNGIPVLWRGAANAGPMFEVNVQRFIVGNLRFNNIDSTNPAYVGTTITPVGTVFRVNAGGDLAVRAEAVVGDVLYNTIGIDVGGNGTLEVNQSTISGSQYSVVVRTEPIVIGGISQLVQGRMLINVVSDQNTIFNGVVRLEADTRIELLNSLNNTITVSVANEDEGIVVAEGTPEYALTAKDRSRFAYVNDAFGFARDIANNTIYLVF